MAYFHSRVRELDHRGAANLALNRVATSLALCEIAATHSVTTCASASARFRLRGGRPMGYWPPSLGRSPRTYMAIASNRSAPSPAAQRRPAADEAPAKAPVEKSPDKAAPQHAVPEFSPEFSKEQEL